MTSNWTAPHWGESKPERKAGYLLEARVLGDIAGESENWPRLRADIFKLLFPLEPDHPGSWNWNPIALGYAYLRADISSRYDGRVWTARSLLLEFFQRQTSPSHPRFHKGHMGGESMSGGYAPFVSSTALAVWEAAKKRGDREMQAAAALWLRQYVFLLSLGAIAVSGGFVTHIANPGERTQSHFHGSDLVNAFYERSAFFGTDRDSSTVKAARRLWYNGRHWAWPGRVLAEADFGWLSASDRLLIRSMRAHGRRVAQVVAELRAMNVRLRKDFEWRRYADGVAGAQTHGHVSGSTPPLLAASVVEGRPHYCEIFPGDFRGGVGSQRIGKTGAEFRAHGVLCWSEEAQFGAFRSSVKGHWVSAKRVEYVVPIPTSSLIYGVKVGPSGVELDGETVERSPDPPGDSSALVERLRPPINALLDSWSRIQRGEGTEDDVGQLGRSGRHLQKAAESQGWRAG